MYTCILHNIDNIHVCYEKGYNASEIILLISVFHTSIELACPKLHVNQYTSIYTSKGAVVINFYPPIAHGLCV